MDYNINDLFNFVEIANLKTITEGARKLNISQPSLTESIKKLEKSLGLVLFYRSRNGIQLTPSGRELLKQGKKLKLQYEEVLDICSKDRASKQEKITIGAHSTVAQYLFPKVIAKIKNKNPNLDFGFVHDLSRNIQEKVQKGEIDFAVVINPRVMPDLIIKELAQDKVGFFSTKKENLNSLLINTIICNPDLYQTNTLLKKAKINSNSIIETSSLELIARFIEEGVGIGILPERVAKLISDKIKLQEHFPTLKDSIALVFRPEVVNDHNLKMISEEFKNQLSIL